MGRGRPRGARGASASTSTGRCDRWASLRDEIRRDILANGVDDRGVFVQSYGSKHLDASLLNVPLVGFLPATDPRVVNTVEAIQRELMDDGFVLRYRTDTAVDGLPGDEGTFLLCTFWLADALALMHRTDEARAIFERLLALRNDVGLARRGVRPASRAACSATSRRRSRTPRSSPPRPRCRAPRAWWAPRNGAPTSRLAP